MAVAGRQEPVLPSRPEGSVRRAANRHPAGRARRRGAVSRRLRRAERRPADPGRRLAGRAKLGRWAYPGRGSARQEPQPRCGLLMYLVDTNVVSEARRGSPQATGWLRSVDPASVRLSALTLGEIMRGVALKQKADPKAAGHLAEWLRKLR